MVLTLPQNVCHPIGKGDLAFKLDGIKGRTWLEGLSFLSWVDGEEYDGHFIIVLINCSKVLTRKRLIISVKHFDQHLVETFHQYSCKLSEVEWLDSTATSAKTPSGSFFKWDEAKQQYDVLISFPNITYEFNYIASCRGTNGGHGFRLGDGKVGYSKDKSQYTFNVFFPRAQVKGTINEKQVSGHAFIGRNACNVPLNQVCTASTHFKLHTEDCSFHFIEMYVKRGGNCHTFSYGSFVKDNDLVAVTTDNSCKIVRSVKDPFSGYKPPQDMKFEWRGRTIDGKRAFFAKTEVQAEPPNMPVIDVLANVPRVLRFVVQKLFAKPYMYQYMKPTVVKVQVGENEFEVSGTALYENHFMNPCKDHS